MKLLAKWPDFVIWVEMDGETEGNHAGEANSSYDFVGMCCR
jgi:hypothetical protein